MNFDQNHWFGKNPPMSPNEYEVEIYRHYCKGYKPVCLLGMTEQLQPLCDYMVELYPLPQTKPVIKLDWNDISESCDVIIGDGVLNLEGIQLANKLRTLCKRLVCRVFLDKFEWMKYSKYFPKEFPGASLVIPTQKNIAIVVWE